MKRLDNVQILQGAMKRKTWKCVISMCMAAALLTTAGCSSKTNNSETENAGANTEETSDTGEATQAADNGLIVVGFVQVGSESDWRITNTRSYQDVFTEENGYYLMYADGQQKQENQMKAMRQFILQDVDYIILDPIVETGWDGVLEEAKKAGIPVIIADREISVENEDLYTCWVGSDFYAEGVNAGEWLVSYLETEGRSSENINIVTLQGTRGSTAQIGRTDGFAQVAQTQKNWTMLDQQDGEFTQAKGKELMNEYLNTYEDIDVIISENDNMTFGVLEALAEKGIGTDSEDYPIIISFDAVKDALQCVSSGEIAADFECNPLTAPYVDMIIQQLEKNQAVERIQYVEETYFDLTMDDLSAVISERAY